MNGYVTTKQLAEYYKVTTQTIVNWRKEGLPYIKVGRSVRFNFDKATAWIETKNEKLPFEE